MRVRSYGLSDRGCVREINEDSFAVVSPEDGELAARLGCLMVVADGMGGVSAGEVASAIATRIVPESYFADWDEPEGALSRAIRAASRAIQQDASSRPDRAGMGTTVVAASLVRDRLMVANVGDSRAYLIHRGQIHQVTRDHSLVAELVALGALSPEEARTDPRRNVITRVLGGANSKPELHSARLEQGDIVLLCTDGLYSLVLSQEMLDILGRADLGDAAQELVALANDRGGHDNVTVVLAHLESDQ